MSRSKWKGSFVAKNIFRRSFEHRIPLDDKKIWSRDSVIPSSLLHKKVLVHSGNGFRLVVITEEKIGLKFGEFCYTTKRVKKNASQKKNLKTKK